VEADQQCDYFLNRTNYLEGGNINPSFPRHIKLNLSVEYIIKKQANKENTRLANTTNNINIITNSRSLPAVTLQITPA
jgi:hypothetical protein